MKIIKSLLILPLNILKGSKMDESTITVHNLSLSSISKIDRSASIDESLKSMTDRNYKISDESFAHSITFPKDNDDSDRIKEIIKTLDEILPKDLCRVVGGYDRPNSLEYLYGIIMNKLDPLGEMREKSSLDNENFLENLALIVKGKGDEFPSDDII